MRITQIQFVTSRIEQGAGILSSVFASLPNAEQAAVWASHANAASYCEQYPPERADVGGYYVPRAVDNEDDDVVTIVAPSSGRDVSCYRESPSRQLWTVNFGPCGSEYAAQSVLQAICRHNSTAGDPACLVNLAVLESASVA